MHPAAETYRDLLERLDRWFATERAARPGVIPCAPGCTACCHGLFDISAADQLLLRETVAALPLEARAGIMARADRLMDRVRALAPDWSAPWAIGTLGEARFDAIAEALHDAPCPLLGPDGACLAYEGRPLVCRLIGLPMLTADGLVLENACPIQHRFPAYAALDPVPFDLEALEALERAALEAAALELYGRPDAGVIETTIPALLQGPA